MSATDEVQRGTRNGHPRKVPSKRIAIAAARVLVAADKGVAVVLAEDRADMGRAAH